METKESATTGYGIIKDTASKTEDNIITIGQNVRQPRQCTVDL